MSREEEEDEEEEESGDRGGLNFSVSIEQSVVLYTFPPSSSSSSLSFFLPLPLFSVFR